MGVSFNAIEISLKTGEFIPGFRVSLIMYLITYLLPTQLIPWLTDKIKTAVDNYRGIPKSRSHLHLSSFIAAVAFCLTLIVIEAYLIKKFVLFE